MSLPSILCFGRDATLVGTRQRIFERAGFASQIARNYNDLTLCFEEYAVDVLVICHSVSREECEDAKRLAHSQADPVLVLVLNKGTYKCEADGKDASLDASQGPESLLRTVTALLDEPVRNHEVPRRKKPLPVALQANRGLVF